jgi:cob(I)alamin adenosyltransferase
MAAGLLFVIQGRGKGKTTSAMGMLLRAWGNGLRVAMLQFIKSPEVESGEHRALKHLGIEVVTSGSGFTWIGENAEKNRACSLELWALARQKVASGSYGMLVLDEFTYPLEYGWIPLQEVLEVLKTRPPSMHIVITGRRPPEALVELADCVTEMSALKHHLEKGIRAQPGIEY